MNKKSDIKVVGSRKNVARKGFTEDKAEFLKLCLKLRRDKRLVPKGVYRFKTLEEENQWTTKMLSRRTQMKAGPRL